MAKASDNGRFDVTDPATERTIASVASATVDDAMAALDAAQRLSRAGPSASRASAPRFCANATS